VTRRVRDRGREVTFLVYPDEGHGFVRPENVQDFFARAEEFLAKHLGGRAIPRADVAGASVEAR
jgi:dipeptidyl aminopeptidase/acylaminoacyl peptidase